MNPTPTSFRPTVAIIGAGFSGTVVAIRLLRESVGAMRVILVNRSGPMGRGLAYGTASGEHLLNVPAGNMSAFAEDPGDFVRYCNGIDPEYQANSFVPRRMYGEYLSDALASA